MHRNPLAFFSGFRRQISLHQNFKGFRRQNILDSSVFRCYCTGISFRLQFPKDSFLNRCVCVCVCSSGFPMFFGIENEYFSDFCGFLFVSIRLRTSKAATSWPFCSRCQVEVCSGVMAETLAMSLSGGR